VPFSPSRRLRFFVFSLEHALPAAWSPQPVSALPSGYNTWKGSVLKGTPIEPDQGVAFDWREARRGNGPQLKDSIEILEKTLTR